MAFPARKFLDCAAVEIGCVANELQPKLVWGQALFGNQPRTCTQESTWVAIQINGTGIDNEEPPLALIRGNRVIIVVAIHHCNAAAANLWVVLLHGLPCQLSVELFLIHILRC